MTEETINYRIQYSVSGVNESIRSTQRVLYLFNAVRLSVIDLQQVMSGPTISNVMWTSIQLTRVWTHLHRLVKSTNQAQRIGMAQGIGGIAMRGVGGGVVRQFAVGQKDLAGVMLGSGGPNLGILASLIMMTPPSTMGLLIGAAIVGGYYLIQRNEKNQVEERQKRNREIAKSQGWEY